MIKWRKIFGNQYLGIWFLGFVLFFIQEIPYMIMPFIHLDSNPIMEMQNKYVALDVLEKIFGSLCIAVMILIVDGEVNFFPLENMRERICFGGMLLTILLNFIGWGLYFSGHQSIANMVIFLVLMPPLYYIAIGLWRKNYLLTVVGSAFLLLHVSNVLTSLL